MSNTICVKIKYLPNGYQPIIDYYNQNKPKDSQNLEKLDRQEGGFKIKFDNYDNLDCDENDKIYQLRWSKGKLVSNGYYNFRLEQLKLLYKSLKTCLGEENVYSISIFENDEK